MIDWTEIPDGDAWELFARDFLSEMGFVVDIPPGRGPDGGRDLVVSEQLKGALQNRKFTWLVSCKHFAGAGTAVGTHESDISDRCCRNGADGFIGFYSTMASASLVDRLKTLGDNGKISAFEIFDSRRIEAQIVAMGMTKVVLRYVPTSYGRLRPIQRIFGKYEGLHCEACGEDILAASVYNRFSANVIYEINPSSRAYEAIHVACKGECDRIISERIRSRNHVTAWEDISDLCNPLIYLQSIISYLNNIYKNDIIFSAAAYDKMVDIYIILSQCTLRDINEEDEKRFSDLKEFGLL